jgi:transcription elongation GreA/GreB family factor
MSETSEIPARGLDPDARAQLERELAALRDQRGSLGTDRDEQGLGDRADDAENLQRLDEAALLDDRIAEITRLLATGKPHGGVSRPGLPDGTMVTLRHGDGAVETLRLVADTDTVTPGKEDSTLTLDSPLGKALVGHRAGETVSYRTPGGVRRAEIVSLRTP